MRLLTLESIATEYQRQYAVWDAKTRDIRAEMHKVVEPQAGRLLYKENFDKFPPEIQTAVTTAPARAHAHPVADVLQSQDAARSQ